MPESTFTHSILALFTTPQKAAEIEGDLIEQARARGKLWYAYQVVLTALSLFRAAVFANFFILALMSYAAYELCSKVFFLGVRPLRWHLLGDGGLSVSAVTYLTYALVTVFTFSVGSSLVRLIPRLGAQVAIETPVRGVNPSPRPLLVTKKRFY